MFPPDHLLRLLRMLSKQAKGGGMDAHTPKLQTLEKICSHENPSKYLYLFGGGEVGFVLCCSVIHSFIRYPEK